MRLSMLALLLLPVCLGGCTLPFAVSTETPIVLEDPFKKFEEQSEQLGNTLELESQIQNLFAEQPVVEHAYVYPMVNYTAARTQKVFGQYIAADSGDRFSGYHTGDDVEVTDISAEISVYAITNATVVKKQTVSGYGGVLILEFVDGEVTYHVLYGHLDLASVTANIGDAIVGGTALGLLGEDHSPETDGERKHLHFGIYEYSGTELYAGYVQDDASLTNWVNPSDFLRNHQAA